LYGGALNHNLPPRVIHCDGHQPQATQSQNY
jgi:hypothetical protein